MSSFNAFVSFSFTLFFCIQNFCILSLLFELLVIMEMEFFLFPVFYTRKKFFLNRAGVPRSLLSKESEWIGFSVFLTKLKFVLIFHFRLIRLHLIISIELNGSCYSILHFSILLFSLSNLFWINDIDASGSCTYYCTICLFAWFSSSLSRNVSK